MERPILFNGEMVRAILDGRKTQTRRVVKPQPPVEATSAGTYCAPGKDYDGQWEWMTGDPKDIDTWGAIDVPEFLCPYGQPGEGLWVRETWADVNCEDGPALCYKADRTVRTWHEFSESFGPDYGAGPSMDYKSYPGQYCMWWSDLLNGEPDHSWTPSIDMPRWASRIQLKVTNVRVERLQDISESDAKAEGVREHIYEATGDHPEMIGYITDADGPDDGTGDAAHVTPVGAFQNLWDSINTPRGFGWDTNPWVWVVEFERIT